MIIICNYIYRFLYNINWIINIRSTIVVTGAARGIGSAIAK
ncbi:2,3-dihydro-2,3-dihydroxybenzoate dehydrogenase, partial [Acinetobacter baumannii]|nr:2,3-dihydro-2,3-dihydroxybenzoate dehydrogenase [Acinetobacter baumannii]